MNKDKMLPIPIRDFISGITLPVNVYIKLNDDKFILIAKEGAKTQPEQLASYENKAVEYLWIEKESYPRLSSQTIQLAGMILSRADVQIGRKTQIVSTAANQTFHHLEHLGLDPIVYEQAKLVADVTVQLVENHQSLSKLMESLFDANDHLVSHSIAVSAVATMLGQAHQWQSKATLEKLSLGGLLHDIGKKALPPELLSKPKAHMSFDELQLYESHPFKGLEMATSIGDVPDDIIAMIYQHHENSLGQGYPQKLRDIKIHPFARLIALANEFVNLTLPGPNCPQPKKPHEALNFIDTVMGQPFNREAFRRLQHLVENKVKFKKIS